MSKNEILQISVWVEQDPQEVKDDNVILLGEMWRVENVKQTLEVKVYMDLNKWLECLKISQEYESDEYYILFETFDCWKAAKKIWSNPDTPMAMMVGDEYELIKLMEDSYETIALV